MLKQSIIALSLITTGAMAHGYAKKDKHNHMKKIKESIKQVKEEKKIFKEELKALKPLTFKSHKNYDKNKYGLITDNTLKSWMDNWAENKPKHITGKLVILQGGPTQYLNEGKGYLAENPAEGVYVYDVGLEGACDSSFKRFDGVSEIQGAIIDTEMMNFQLNALNIDPTKDMIVLVTTDSSNDAMKGMTRIWASFKYFSTDMTHVSFLNGSASYHFAPSTESYNYLTSMPSGWPPFGNYDVRTQGASGTALFASMEDMMKDASEKANFHFITDGRGTKEYTGASGSKASDKTCGIDGASQCYTAYRGHIKTAVDMPYNEFYDTEGVSDVNLDGVIDSKDASYEFKSVRELRNYFKDKGYKRGQIVDTYCRTGRKANLALFAASTILGYPARMYDGSWIQWGELANTTDSKGTEILPADNKWRTDIAQYSTVISYEDPINVQPIVHIDYEVENTINPEATVRVNPNGTTTRQQIEEDVNELSK